MSSWVHTHLVFGLRKMVEMVPKSTGVCPRQVLVAPRHLAFLMICQKEGPVRRYMLEVQQPFTTILNLRARKATMCLFD